MKKLLSTITALALIVCSGALIINNHSDLGFRAAADEPSDVVEEEMTEEDEAPIYKMWDYIDSVKDNGQYVELICDDTFRYDIYIKDGVKHAVVKKCLDEKIVDAVIPSEIEGVPVDTISISNLKFCYDLETITFSSGMKYILSGIDNCKKLRSVELPDTVEYISTFNYSSGLESIELPSGLKCISGFRSCHGLKSVTIPDSVMYIEYAFADCSELEEVSLPENVKYISLSSFKNTKWLKDKAMVIIDNELISGASCKGDVIIPDTVKEIGYEAFRRSDIESIFIPGSVKKIGESALFECDNLRKIEIEKGAILGRDYIFNYCNNLEEIICNTSVSPTDENGEGHVHNIENSNVRKITIGESASKLGASCIICPDLLSLTILNPECEISDNLFGNNSVYAYDIPEPTGFGGYDPYLGYCVREKKPYEDLLIRGYKGSTAEAFAEKNGYLFEALDAENSFSGSVNIYTMPRLEGYDETERYDEELGETITCWIPKIKDYVIGEELDVSDGSAFARGELNGREWCTYTKYLDSGYFDIDASEFDNTKPGEYKIYVSPVMCPEVRGYFTVKVVGPSAPVSEAESTEIPDETYPQDITSNCVLPYEEAGENIGDANGDNEIGLADSLVILQNIANSNKYPLTEEALDKADVFNRGDGLTANDALSIQKYDAKLISSLPESYMK